MAEYLRWAESERRRRQFANEMSYLPSSLDSRDVSFSSSFALSSNSQGGHTSRDYFPARPQSAAFRPTIPSSSYYAAESSLPSGQISGGYADPAPYNRHSWTLSGGRQRVAPSTPQRSDALNSSYSFSKAAHGASFAPSSQYGTNVGSLSSIPPALRDYTRDHTRHAASTVSGSPGGYRSAADSSFMTQVSRLAPPSTPRRFPQHTTAPQARASSAGPSFRSPLGRSPMAGLGLLRPTAFSQSRPLLILDLDETLVHASVERRVTGFDFQFLVNMPPESVMVYVKVRPFAEEFLRRMSQLFEVCVFTASVSAYADNVLDRLDPQGRYIHHRLYREHCTFTQGCYVKDLSRMGRSMERLCLVDNSPITYAMQPENGVPIESWFDDMRDTELMRLTPMLEHFARNGNFYETARIYNIVT